MSKPTIQQQLNLVGYLQPPAAPPADFDGFLRLAAARLDFRIENSITDSAVHVAAYSYDYPTLLALLLNAGDAAANSTMTKTAVASVRDSLGRTPLHYAADSVDQLQGLVNVFAEPPAELGPTVLSERVQKVATTGIEPGVKSLGGADANGANSVLRMAADHTQAAVVDALSTAQLSCIRVLLAYGADPTLPSARSGATALHLAARSGAVRAAEALLLAGSQIEARDRHGQTALVVAAAAGQATVVELLLHHGARLDARDARGRTAAWYARASGSALHPDAARRLFGEVHKQTPPADGVPLPHATSTVDPNAVLKPTTMKLEQPEDSAIGWGHLDNMSWPDFHSIGSKYDTPLSVEKLDLCEFDRIAASDLDSRQFEADFLLPGRPVSILRAADSMPARRTWTRHAFFARAGSSVFAPQKLPIWRDRLLRDDKASESHDHSATVEIPLAQYFSERAAGRHPRPLLWNAPRNATLWNELQAELVWPSSLQAPSIDRAGAAQGHFELFLGPQGAGASMHHHKAAWNALLFGRKLWVLTPPASSRFRRNELAADSFLPANAGEKLSSPEE
eukprot:SAG31_NODE_6203_length_2125_cov_1.220138_1_plen_566_part_10